MPRTTPLLAAAAALVMTGCEMEKYDDYTDHCSVSDGRVKVRVEVYRDSDEPRSPTMNEFVNRLCADVAREQIRLREGHRG